MTNDPENCEHCGGTEHGRKAFKLGANMQKKACIEFLRNRFENSNDIENLISEMERECQIDGT